eukprot:11589534-Prorocentrum_lima.AAC.1
MLRLHGDSLHLSERAGRAPLELPYHVAWVRLSLPPSGQLARDLSIDPLASLGVERQLSW